MTRDEAILEAKRRWPPDYSPATTPSPIRRWGAVREGLFLAVGVGIFDLSIVSDNMMVDFEIKGYGTTWEAAFAMADRAARS